MSRTLKERKLSLKTDTVEFCSDEWGIDGASVFNMLSNTGILQVVEESYDVLHTVGNQYLVCWVEEALENRGVNINDIKK